MDPKNEPPSPYNFEQTKQWLEDTVPTTITPINPNPMDKANVALDLVKQVIKHDKYVPEIDPNAKCTKTQFANSLVYEDVFLKDKV